MDNPQYKFHLYWTRGKILNRYDFSLNKLTSNNFQWQLSFDLHKCGGSYQPSNCLHNTIYTPIIDRIKQVILLNTTLRILKILYQRKRETDFIIGGFVTSQLRSPLIPCFHLPGFQGHQDPEHPAYWFLKHHQG